MHSEIKPAGFVGKIWISVIVVSLAIAGASIAVFAAVRPAPLTFQEAYAMEIDAAYTKASATMMRIEAQAKNERESTR